jgi:hypothetical protein
MSADRGHQSIYFKEPEVLHKLEKLSEEDLNKEVSISAIVCEVVGKALPEIIKQVKKGKRRDIELTITINL